MKDIFESRIRGVGDFAGVFEYDGETAYFYLYDVREPSGGKVIDAIHILSGETDISDSEFVVAWDSLEQKVGLFIRGTLWALFNTGARTKSGGNFIEGGKPQIPPAELFALRLQ